jgi:hypothetical protein
MQQQDTSASTQSVNPDITFPPNNPNQQAIVTSRPNVGHNGSPQIDNWIEAPSGGTYVLASINGSIQWIETESC